MKSAIIAARSGASPCRSNSGTFSTNACWPLQRASTAANA
ncbi:hypothetical protein BURPSS13_C0109 [Burkholderia pseudomallei S13]|nr:hypothetical protein BURPSS13_C0109 [Burkholderia pseudomallei S13]